jgi:hypothetical protein
MRGIGARSRILTLGAGALLLVGVGGVAYAAASGSAFIGSNGSITSCLPPRGGEIKVWLPGHRCSGGWAQLNWAAVGATGTSGATGATGPINPDSTTVDGQSVTKLLLREPTPGSGTTTATLYGGTGSGLTILADCDSSGNASLVANGPSSNDAELTVSGYGTSGAYGSQTGTLGSASNAVLGPAGSGDGSFSYASSSGGVVTGTIGYQKANSFNNYAGCAFFGHVTAG